MQVSEKLYVDIEIPDLGVSNFLKGEDMISFKLVESAGASLPYIIMMIRVYSTETANYFQQNNKVVITFGDTLANADSFPMIVEMADINNDPSNSAWIVEFSGFLYSKEYLINQESKAYTGTSLDVARTLYREVLKKPINTTIESVAENAVTWRRINQTARDFLLDVLLHMRIHPSFPLFAIDRYGNLIIKDFKVMCDEGPKFTLTSDRAGSYVIMNNFNIVNNRDMYNLFAGYNRRTEILKSSSGKSSTVIADSSPILATTQVSEGLGAGSTTSSNEVQSDNVHDWYKETYIYNTNNQVALSSINGDVQLIGRYYREIAPLDLVKVVTNKGKKNSIDGLYIVETVTTIARYDLGTIYTTLTLTRDNKNYIENYVRVGKGMKVRSEFVQELCAATHDLRVAYAVAKQFMDGTFMGRLLSFGIASKRNILRMFSVAGVSIDFNSSADLLKSMILLANSLMNTLVSMIFPENVAAIFRDYLIRKPSLKALLLSYLSLYVPAELLDVVIKLINSLDKSASSLNSIAKDNGISISTSKELIVDEDKSKVIEEDDTVDNSQQRVVNIIDTFIENTSGVDIPFPLINLTESEEVLSESALRNLIANETIANLTNLGYMEDVDADKLKDVLLGDDDLTFNMINQLNKNAGNTYNYRFWGTFTSLIELTSFKIKNSYKDKYRTLPCTKLINATQGAQIFFACPKAESNLKFYINSVRAEVGKVLDTFEIDLGYKDSAGNSIIYLVYYTTAQGYNSNSVMFEVKQGSMV